MKKSIKQIVTDMKREWRSYRSYIEAVRQYQIEHGLTRSKESTIERRVREILDSKPTKKYPFRVYRRA